MQKVIFIDVDGTLRTDTKEITKRTINALSRIKSIGYEPILCTGRARNYAENLNNIINGSRYIIYSSGAGVFDSLSRKVLYENPMNTDSVVSLYKATNSKGVGYIFACNGVRYVNKLKYHDGSEILIDEPIEFLSTNEIVQATIFSPNFEVVKQMQPEIQSIPYIKIMNQSKSLIDSNFVQVDSAYYDIVDENTSKGNGIEQFCKIFDIPKENRISVGDDINDISMFEQCGYNVAMGNALPVLKDLSNYVTDNNNNDGLAKFLDKL